jgi:methyl-accepting chemotaxis protein
MADETPPRRLLGLLRRKPRTKTLGQNKDSNLLWLSHERAVTQIRQTGEAVQHISSSIARQRMALDSALDRSRAVYGRADELMEETRGIAESLEKLLIVSMNASLEGARQPEGAGQPFLVIGEEIRAQARRGLDLVNELRTSASELANSVSEATAAVDQAKESSMAVLSEAGRASASSGSAERALEEIREILRRTTGTDPETMRLLGEAAEHAKSLVSSLGTLSGKVPKSLMASVLRPTIEPLLSLLATEASEDEGPET